MEDWLKIILGIPAFIVVAVTLPFVFLKSRLEVQKLRLEIEALGKSKTEDSGENILREKIEESRVIFFSRLATYLGILAFIALFFFGTYIKAISVTLYFGAFMGAIAGATAITTDIVLFGSLWKAYRNWKRRRRLTRRFQSDAEKTTRR